MNIESLLRVNAMLILGVCMMIAFYMVGEGYLRFGPVLVVSFIATIIFLLWVTINIVRDVRGQVEVDLWPKGEDDER